MKAWRILNRYFSLIKKDRIVRNCQKNQQNFEWKRHKKLFENHKIVKNFIKIDEIWKQF